MRIREGKYKNISIKNISHSPSHLKNKRERNSYFSIKNITQQNKLEDSFEISHFFFTPH